MTEDNTIAGLVEALAAEFIDRRRRGERPTIAEYEARHPQAASEIRALFPTIAALEGLRTRQEAGPDGRASLGPRRPARLGDYRIVAELGRGGMGVVYEAVQESLNRRVAVKVLARQALGDDSHRRRFLREARTAGRLHHTNIVPILGVGEHEGLDYYVMQRIDGVGLDVVLDRLGDDASAAPSTLHIGSAVRPGRSPLTHQGLAPTVSLNDRNTDLESPAADPPAEVSTRFPRHVAWRPTASYWREAAQVGLQAARAIEYAHQHGTLHRDIKPANLILDSEGNTWVTDFGLAKATEDDRLSRTGEVLGTFLYAAPEQFRGVADRRSDVFSLGATLFELLTLRPPFARDERMLAAVRENAVPARQGNLRIDVPGVPRDLATIVLKSIADDPRDRYQTAADLAADLERFLADEPILARPPGIAERWIRWGRRNRREAWLTGLSAGLLLLIAVVASAGFVATRLALNSESRQRQRSEQSLAVSLAALDKVFGRLVPGPWGETGRADFGAGPQPVVSPDTAALLEDLLPLYDKLAEQQDRAAAASVETARALRRLGDIHLHLGDLAKAESDYQRAIGQFTALAAGASAANWTLELARLRNQRGMIFARQGKTAEANSEHRAAVDLLGRLTAEQAGVDGQLELARSHYLLGRRPAPLLPLALAHGPPPHDRRPDGHQGQPAGPLQGGPYPADGREPPPPPFNSLGPPPPDGPVDRPPPATAAYPFNDGQPTPESAHADGRHGEDHRPPPPDAFQAHSPPRSDLAELQSAVDILEPLLTSAGDRPEPRYLLALCCREMASPAPLPDHDRTVALLNELLARNPRVADYRYELAATYSAFDIHRLSPAEMPAADERLRLAVEQSQRLVEEHPYATDYLQLHIHNLHKRGTLLNQMLRDPRPVLDPGGVAAQAAAALQEAVRREAAFVERFPDDPACRIWLAQFRASLSNVQMAQHAPDQAQQSLQAAIANLQPLIAASADAEQGRTVRRLTHELYRMLAESFRAQQRFDAAREAERMADAPPGEDGAP